MVLRVRTLGAAESLSDVVGSATECLPRREGAYLHRRRARDRIAETECPVGSAARIFPPRPECAVGFQCYAMQPSSLRAGPVGERPDLRGRGAVDAISQS